ncbi:MAG: hypothetical protein ABFC57_12880 [Veillonellales bacterium]
MSEPKNSSTDNEQSKPNQKNIFTRDSSFEIDNSKIIQTLQNHVSDSNSSSKK